MADKQELIIQVKGEDLITGMLKEVEKRQVSSAKKIAKAHKDSWAMVATGINQVMEIAGKVGQAFDKVWAAASEGAKSLDLRAALDRKTQGSATQLLDEASEAVRGTVSEFELLKSINMMQSFGIPAAKATKLMEVAYKAAIATGQDMEYMLSSVTTAVSRQSPMILDNLGITLKVSEAHKIYAAQLGITVSKMTDAQKAAAFMNAAIEKGNKAFAHVEGMKSHASALKRLETGWEDFKQGVKETIAEALIGAVDWFSRLTESTADSEARLFRAARAMADFQAKVEDLGTYINSQAGKNVLNLFGAFGLGAGGITEGMLPAHLRGTGRKKIMDVSKVTTVESKDDPFMMGEIGFDALSPAEQDAYIKSIREWRRRQKRKRKKGGRGGGRAGQDPVIGTLLGEMGPTSEDAPKKSATIEFWEKEAKDMVEVQANLYDTLEQMQYEHDIAMLEQMKAADEQRREQYTENIGNITEGLGTLFDLTGQETAMITEGFEQMWEASGPEAAQQGISGISKFVGAVMSKLGWEAAGKAVMHTAEGIAALIPPGTNPPKAAGHFAAAAMFAATAAIAGTGGGGGGGASVGASHAGSGGGSVAGRYASPSRALATSGSGDRPAGGGDTNVYINGGNFVGSSAGNDGDVGVAIGQSVKKAMQEQGFSFN